MPAFIPLIAAGVGAAATIYATERAKAGQKGFAPTADFGGGKTQSQFQIPQNLFGSTSLLGGSGFKPTLSQTLENQPPSTTSPAYGPRAGTSPFEQYQMQNQIQSLGRGK